MDGSDWIRLTVIVFLARILSRDIAIVVLVGIMVIHSLIFVAQLFFKGTT